MSTNSLFQNIKIENILPTSLTLFLRYTLIHIVLNRLIVKLVYLLLLL